MSSIAVHSPQRLARLGGVLYLAIILLGGFGELFVRGTLVVPGDPAATLNAIAAAPLLWRAGIAGDLLMHVLDLPLILIFYLLLRPVNHAIALLATLLNLVQTAVLAVNKLNLLVPLFLLQGTGPLQAFAPEQLQALASLAIRAHGHGFGIGLVFFGFACLARAYLIHRSGYLPRALGLLLALAGLSYLVNSFALLLAPALAASMFPAILVPALVGELALCLWLMFAGVRMDRVATARLNHLLADAVLVLHVAVVLFIVGGLVLVVLGNLRRWHWVNAWWFRLAHLGAIGFVVAEAWLGLTCPLTTLEMWLRARAGGATYGGGFIEHWLQRLLYWDAPAWVFTLAYSLFGLLVVATWWRYPPRRRSR